MRTRHSVRSRSVTELHELSTLWGIEVTYEDVTGRCCQSTADSLLAVLPILGATVSGMAEVHDALHERRRALWQRCLEPVAVAWNGATAGIRLRLPLQEAHGRMECRLQSEEHEDVRWLVRLEELPNHEKGACDGVLYVIKQLPLPHRLPSGYHRLSLEVHGRQLETLLIAAPTRAYSPHGHGWQRSWGVFLPLYALHSRQSWGAGDFGDLRRLRRWAHSMGANLVGTLPLLAAFLDEPFEASPYSPVSRMFWNEFYVNVEEIPDLATTPSARALLESSAFRNQIESLRAQPLVDYRQQMAMKRQVLEELARSVFQSLADRRAALERYVTKHPSLDDYASFRALCDRFKAPWTKWPSALRDGRVTPADYSQDSKNYHLYVQWLADTQLIGASVAGDGTGMYLDLPLGVHAHGYDVWRERAAFAVGAAGGCPPDMVFPKGQNWGFVPLHPEGIREQGYRYVRDYLRHQARLATVLRIDHMPSFHRVFWIPPGMDAGQGCYVRYPAEELYAVFSLESHRSKTMLVGEDLGTVPREVPEAMARHNFHRMHVIQYELKPDPGLALPEPPPSAIATINTHDMPPFAGFWNGTDLDDRLECGLISMEQREEQDNARQALREALVRFLASMGLVEEQASVREVLHACIAHLCDGPARIALINLEDLWQETRSQNVPSTCEESINWRRKAHYSLDEFMSNPDVLEILQRLANTIGTCWPTVAEQSQRQ